MIKLYLDEDVPEAVAAALRLRGYDTLTVREAGRKGLTDREHLDYAFSEGRVMFTHNIVDFARIHGEFVRKGWEHNGIILSRQLPIGTMVRALLRLLSVIRTSGTHNKVIWLSDWIA
jgi:predicted nuclease of predicted toxin-antitoxin system